MSLLTYIHMYSPSSQKTIITAFLQHVQWINACNAPLCKFQVGSYCLIILAANVQVESYWSFIYGVDDTCNSIAAHVAITAMSQPKGEVGDEMCRQSHFIPSLPQPHVSSEAWNRVYLISILAPPLPPVTLHMCPSIHQSQPACPLEWSLRSQSSPSTSALCASVGCMNKGT